MATSNDPAKAGSIRMQVSVNEDGHPDLYKLLAQLGPYHRAKRIIHLAELGLDFKDGKLPQYLPNAKTPAVSKTEFDRTSSEKTDRVFEAPVVALSNNALGDIEDMFDLFDRYSSGL
jgi:hypothetical protein